MSSRNFCFSRSFLLNSNRAEDFFTWSGAVLNRNDSLAKSVSPSVLGMCQVNCLSSIFSGSKVSVYSVEVFNGVSGFSCSLWSESQTQLPLRSGLMVNKPELSRSPFLRFFGRMLFEKRASTTIRLSTCPCGVKSKILTWFFPLLR